MRSTIRVAGALCIVVAMLLGAVAGFVYVRPDASSAESSATGSRNESPELVAIDGSPADSEPTTGGAPIAFADSAALPEGLSVSTTRISSDAGTESGGTTIRTRGTSSTGGSSVWPPGTIDAGGPYGGPGSLEGSTDVTFTVTANDPAILFFRWDFNNDGVFDYPVQTGSPLGTWTTQTTVTRHFDDSFFGDVVAQGWDGLTQNPPVIITGNGGLNGRTAIDWSIGFFGGVYHNIGLEFVAKKDMVITRLGHFHSPGVTYYNMAIFSSGAWPSNKLGECIPIHAVVQWNWCDLSPVVNLQIGQTYFVFLHFQSSTYGFNPPADTDHIDHRAGRGAFCFDPAVRLCWGQPGYAPITFSYLVGPVDLEWREVVITPDAAVDTASLQVDNVAPAVFGVTTNPSPGLEGTTPVEHVAAFSDPGLGDTWQYRWVFADGTTSGWLPVDKLAGGANVLILHSYSDNIGNLRPQIAAACGIFCKKVDVFDMGPLGLNRAPTLAELLPYDVVVVGTNYGVGGGTPQYPVAGDRLAEFMDSAAATGGGVVMLQAGFDSGSGNTFGIAGRWESEMYTPIPRGSLISGTVNLGAVYVAGHPILDGVSTLRSGGLRPNVFTSTPGATRVADFTNGHIAVATKENPVVANGARAVALPWFPYSASGPPYISGDWARVIANAIRWASRQADPTVKQMPITLDPVKKIYPDDDPTSVTPIDSFPVSVEVRDDDHGTMNVFSTTERYFQDFNSVAECTWASGTTYAWPAGWTANPTTGWRCQVDQVVLQRGPGVRYNFNFGGVSDLVTAPFDLTGFAGGRVEWRNFWAGGDPIFGGSADGFVDASIDDGVTFPFRLAEFHMSSPKESKDLSFQTSDIGGFANVRFRFRWQSIGTSLANWFFDNFRVTGLTGEIVAGLGSTSGTVSIANVPPTLVGGFSSALSVEGNSLLFKGFSFSDPALFAPTESYMYAVDFGDGSPVVWRNLGSFGAPFKLKVLVVQTLCSSGNACAFMNTLRNNLLALDIVGSVDAFNFISPIGAPPLALLLQYDVVIVAMNFGTSTALWEAARRNLGNNLATYLEDPTPGVRRGVLTMLGPYTGNFPAGTNNFVMLGRYADWDYGAFEVAPFRQSAATLGPIVDDDHDAYFGVRPGQVSTIVHDGDMVVSTGGQGLAAGQTGALIADWDDGASAFGAKELGNGRKTAHIGAFGTMSGNDAGSLLRGALGWAAGGMSIPRIKGFTHAYGDNGVYTVDLMTLDDDMGYEWDPVAGAPRQVLPGGAISHRTVTVAVDNTDPALVPGSIQAFIAAQLCVRVSGQAGNTVSVSVFQDGVLGASTSVTRIGGDPNPPTEKCGFLRLDVRARHAYSAEIAYAQPNGGTNPTWLVFNPWRDPVSPGHGTVTYKFDLAAAGTTAVPLPTLKRDLLEGGLGARIDFAAEAGDAGTDDLAFFWSWGGEADLSYAISPLSVYTIHVFHNQGGVRTDGALAGSQDLGFSEPFFDRAANTGLSAPGTTNFVVHDTATHAFAGGQTMYWIFLAVLDDDNGRGYASPYGLDGIDVEVFTIDLG